MSESAQKSQERQTTPAENDGWPIKEVWEKYEQIAMHFNDLLIKLRTQALAAVAAISTVVGIFSRTGADEKVSWGLAAAVFFFLCLFWIAVWIIDFCYYNRLLLGAVDAILDLETISKENTHILHIDISTKIERAVAGERPSLEKERRKRLRRLIFGRWAFYIIVFLALVGGFGFSITQHAFLDKRPDIVSDRGAPQTARPLA
jgi:hypothetical protein